MWSIRRRLLIWLLSGVLVSGVAAMLAIYVQTREEVDEFFDRQLRQIALSLREQQDLSIAAAAPDVEVEQDDEIVTSAWDVTGKPIFGLAEVRPVPSSNQRGFRTEMWNGKVWRAYVAVGSGGTVEVSQALATRATIAMAMAARIVLPIVALIFILIPLVWIAVGRALAPLADATKALATINSDAIHPVAIVNPAKEVKPFVAALNNLLKRLAQQVTRQEHFVSDAAHELRTPLAALQVQLELLESAGSPEDRRSAIAQLRRGIERLTHLGQQLLTMARLGPTNTRPPAQAVDLSEVAMEVVGELWLLAKTKEVDLGSLEHEPMFVRGDADALKIMVRNIVDNAIKYTPRGGKVDINLRRHASNVELEVIDTGIGIPREERERVFDRFYRGISQTTSGSGLGLAIVERIAHQNSATIELHEGKDGRGLCFCVSLAAVPH
jgi:two-component system, OmpR family, sensor kinase